MHSTSDNAVAAKPLPREIYTLAFVNELVPKLEDERSEFFPAARAKLRLGFMPNDQWTVDKQSNMALIQTGGGRDMESQREEYWPQ